MINKIKVDEQVYDVEDARISEENLKSWNNKSDFSGDYQDLTNKPTKLSQFENDEKFATESEIPDTSEFVTKTVSDLINYYLKSEVYTKEEVLGLISQISTLQLIPVDTLPTENIQTNAIYLVPSEEPAENNVKDEYIYINGDWEIIGSTKIDLSGYALKTDVPTKLSDLVNDMNFIDNTVNNLENYYLKSEINDLLANIDVDLPIASTDTLGGIKVGSGLSIDADGVLSSSGSDEGPIILNYATISNADSMEKLTKIVSAYQKDNTLLDAQLVYPVPSDSNNKRTLKLVNIFLIVRNREYYLEFSSIHENRNSGSANTQYIVEEHVTVVVTSTSTTSANLTFNYATANFPNPTSNNIKALSYVYLGTKDPQRVLSTQNSYPYTPTSDYDPSTKKYVDDAIAEAIANLQGGE